MKTLLFAFLISLPLNINAQTVDINFLVTDGYWPLLSIRVGLDSTATNGLDPHLGEYRLPMFEGFGAVFDISPYTDTTTYTLKDYRYAPSFPFTGIIEHRLGWQLSYWGIAFTIYYNFPPGVAANLSDEFGGIFFNENLSDSGSYTVQNNLIHWAILTMYYDNVIPVELNSFTASVLQNENAVQLNWSTATETNNSGFEVERGSDNKTFEKIGQIKGKGTTTEKQKYIFRDVSVSSKSKFYYRLKQVDYDGTVTYSDVIEVDYSIIPDVFSLSQNYPNPFNPVTNIKFGIPVKSSVVLKVFNSIGEEVDKLVNEEKEAGTYQVEFNATGLPSGIYFYRIQAGDPSAGSGQSFVETKKMILMK